MMGKRLNWWGGNDGRNINQSASNSRFGNYFYFVFVFFCNDFGDFSDVD
jgi:hypothetical protein